ncbi:hypothetical protein N9N67_08470 [Bacteriovoracaceae bacterium]|nr:hypothetical protein [Bacteriovoracaceae bacterium]
MIKLISLESGIKAVVNAVNFFLISLFFLPITLIADGGKGKDPNRYPTIIGTNVNLDFADGSGVGLVEHAFYEIYPVTIQNDNLNLAVDLTENKLKLKEEKFEIVIGVDFSFLKDFDRIKMNLEELSVKNQNISLSIPSLDLEISGQEYEVDKLKLNSVIKDMTKKADLKNNLIANATFSISKLKFGKVKLSDYEAELREENTTVDSIQELAQLLGEDNKKGLIKYIHQIKFSLKDGSLKLTGKVKTLLNMKILLTAKVKNDEQNKQIHINVKKMKVGVVNVRKAVLKYLKGLKITNLRVNHRSGEIVYVYK